MEINADIFGNTCSNEDVEFKRFINKSKFVFLTSCFKISCINFQVKFRNDSFKYVFGKDTFSAVENLSKAH